MASATPLNELFQIKARFSRSVSLAVDYYSLQSLDGYVLSPLGRTILRRIAEGLGPSSRARAWSITGPYGAGKSSFALFLARMLSCPIDKAARDWLQAGDGDLYTELYSTLPGLKDGGFFIIPVVGSREPLDLAIVRGLRRSLLALARGDSQIGSLVENLREVSQQIERGGNLPAVDLAEIIQHANGLVRAAVAGCLGTLLIIDELGKLLEYAALNPVRSDIFALQTLAEAALRSGDAPFALVVILHQAFERYAARLNPFQQREWAKVQGRFEDIGFLEPTGELLKLLGEAIQPVSPLDGLKKTIDEEIKQGVALRLLPRGLSPQEAGVALIRCAPLHPTVALLLGKLFRSRLAQNERSLFAFLTSGEPYGFQEYLSHEEWRGDGYRPFYRLDQLYDYVVAALGSALYLHQDGKKWAEIENALERLPAECSRLDARLVKTIGLLSILGDQRYLKAAEAVLAYALSDGRHVTPKDVSLSLERLRTWGIVLYRQHREAYGLWEGSDIDLDEHFRKGLDQIDRAGSLASFVREWGQVKPYIAKRHLHQTGTLRFFAPWVGDARDLADVVGRPFGAADGAVVFVLNDEQTSPEEIVRSVVDLSEHLEAPRREMMFFAIPRDTEGLREVLMEVMALNWVQRNTPELEGDQVARRELAARQIDAESRLNMMAGRIFDRAASHSSCLWVHAGQRVTFRTATELAAALSDACDGVYHAAPIVHNELINRRALSSAATAARRNLIERMLTYSDQPRLGIEGYPPELSMYRSVLEASGLHHADGARWVFGPLSRFDPSRVSKLWEGIDSFLTITEDGKRLVSELFQMLREPPYGIRDGLLPVYLAAAMLHWDAEVALYENGSFVPKADIAVFERLMKVPEQFAIQRYRLSEARSYLFEKYSSLLGRVAQHHIPTLVTAVRPLLVFVQQLPQYTRLTRRLSPEAIAVREVILTAREPHRLLFEDLPKAVGVKPQQVSADLIVAHDFFAALRKALLELERAYDVLLTDIQAQLTEAMRLPSDLTAARTEAAQRAAWLQERVADLRLKAFVLRLADQVLPDREWLESVAAALANKPPRQWNDSDVLRYGNELAELAGRFRRVEEIVLEARLQGDNCGPGRLIRLGVTDQDGQEWRDFVRLAPDEEAEVQAAANVLANGLRELTDAPRLSAAVVAELARRTLIESAKHEEKP